MRGRSAEAESAHIALASTIESEPSFAILQSVAIVEDYVDSMLDLLAARGDAYVSTHPFDRAASALASEAMHKNWPSRRAWMTKTLGSNVGDLPSASDMALLVQLRNALAHGLGSLTRAQRSNVVNQLQLETQLKDRFKMSFAVAGGGAMSFPADISTRVVGVAISYVTQVDEVAAPKLRPRYRDHNVPKGSRR